MEKTGCKIICGAPATLAVKGTNDDDDEQREGSTRFPIRLQFLFLNSTLSV